MEYVAGPTLAARIAETGGLPPREAARIVAEVADGLGAAHADGLVHRDVKPSNILLARREVVSGENTGTLHHSPLITHDSPKLTDFGLARVLSEQSSITQQGIIAGTPSYISPEDAAGGAAIGPAADIYGLGVTLYEALTGFVPFRGSPQQVLRQVQTVEPTSPRRLNDAIPRDLETICLKCLEKQPRKRYASAGQLASDLRRYLDGRPIHARRVGAWERGLKWSRRRPAAAALAGTLALAAAGAVAGTMIHNARLRSAVNLADAERARAREGYRHAREAVDKLLSEVGFGALAEVPEADDARRALLAEAAGFYRRFIDEEPDPTADLRGEYAKALRRLARIERVQGDYQAAERDLGEAVRRGRELVGEFPSQGDLADDLASAESDLAVIYGGLGRGDESEAASRRAIGIWGPWVASHPEMRANLANCYESLANQIEGRRAEQAESLQRQALEIREQLALANPADPTAQAVVAQSHYNLGVLYARGLHRGDDALSHLERACELWEGLVDRDPPLYAQHVALAECHNLLGIVLAGMGRGAEEHFQRTLDLAGMMARRHPSLPGYRTTVAVAHANLGLRCYVPAGRMDEARAEFDLALTICRELVDERPHDRVARFRLAETCVNFCQCATDPSAKEVKLREALAALEPLFVANPSDWRAHFLLGGVCNNLAISLRDQGRTDEAIGSHQKAIEAFEVALGGTPDSAEVRLQCLIAHGAAAVTRAAAGRHSEAARDWDRVVDLADEHQRDGFRLHRAISQTLAGEHEKAADEVEKMLAEGERSDDERYNAACFFARAAGAARTDGRLADGERLSHAGVYSCRALGILDELRRDGYFLAPEKAAQLRADADFDPLHALPEFQELLARVGSPAATE